MTDELDRLTSLAKKSAEARFDEHTRQEMVRRAVLAGQGRHRARRQRWVSGAAGVLALAAAALLALHAGRGVAPTTVASDYELSLPTGDEVLARGDVRFEVESQTSALRRVRLDAGAMLFDVASLGSGSVFEVVTHDTTVRVLGTVFVVESSSRGTSVTVYEGRVELAHGVDRSVLSAGDRSRPELATAQSTVLDDAARTRAARRHPPTTTTSAELGSPAVGHTPETSFAETVVSVPGRALATAPAVASDSTPQPTPMGGARSSSPQSTTDVDSTPPGAPSVSPGEIAAERVASDESSSETVTAPGPLAEGEPSPPSSPEAAPSASTAIGETTRRARAALQSGDAEQALALAREGGADASLRLVEADALRMLGRTRESARAYDRVVELTADPRERAIAGFLGAELWYRRFREPEHATAVLLQSGALDDSTLRERTLSLRADLALATQDASALVDTCRTYLAEYPSGPRATWMRAHQ